MKRFLFFTICLLLPLLGLSQTKSALPDRDMVSEKLITQDGKLYFFMNSPLSYFGNYNDLYDSFPRMFKFASGQVAKPYDCRWQVIKGNLYMVKLTPNQWNETTIKDEKGEFVDKNYEPTPQKAFQEKMEQFTQRKFDKKGRVKADWLDGAYKLSSVQQNPNSVQNSVQESITHLDSLNNRQTYYLAHFKKGKLLKMEETDKDWNPKK